MIQCDANYTKKLMKLKIYYILLLLLTVTQGALAQGITVSEDPESTFVPTTIVNGSFDDEPWMVFTYGGVTYNTCKDDTGFDTTSKDNEDGYAQNVVFNGVNGGWNTTDRSIWRSSLFEYTNSVDGTHNHQHNSSIPQTDKYVEMNNYHSCMLYQDLRTNSHDVIRWTLKHAVTPAGDEYQPIRVEIGAPNLDGGGNIINASGWASDLNPQINLDTKAIYRYDGVTDKNGNASTIGFGSETDLQYLRLHNTATDQQEGWWMAQGVYAIPEGQTVTRFGFISEADKQNQGNLLDDLTFSTLIGNLSAQQLANNDVEVKGYWGETDASKRFKVVIDGVTRDIDMSSVVGKNFRIIIPAAIVGTATSVEAYHSDYKVAENTIAVRPVYSSTLQEGTEDAAYWSITPAVAEVGTTINVTYSGSMRPASVATIPVASTWTMEYTGAIQTFTAPATGVYELQVWGAQGGFFYENQGGKGGYAICRTNLTADETIYIYVGGKGGDGVSAAGGAGGWNGGGHGGIGVEGYRGSAGGGGATHISKVNNQIIGNGCNFLGGTNYIIVAGGGGGAGHPYTSPGAGGGTEGGKGTRCQGSSDSQINYSDNFYYSTSQSYGANGGNGAAFDWGCEGAGGGGGGYYGGTSNYPNGTFDVKQQDAGGCGGNSAYNSDLASNFSTTAGQRSGNGKAEIRLISITEAPTPTAATKIDDTHWRYTIPNYNVEVLVEYHEYPGTGTENDPYIIASTEDWNNLADQVNAGKTYAGKYFRQTEDFTVSSKIIGYPTDDTHFVSFNGIYDGNGRTITASISKSDERYVAPFHCIADATIKNVIVTGSVAVSGSASIERRRHPAGLVGVTAGTCIIQNCKVSANISGCDYLGGILGHSMGANLTMTGCVYTGTITASDAYYTGGLIGWGGGTSGLSVSIVDCLFAGSYSGSGKFHPVGCYYTPDTDSRSVSNTYYTVATTMDEDDVSSFVKGLSNKGKMRYSITGTSEVTVANAGEVTNYMVSGITSYGTGIKYGTTYYAGDGDVVSLTLSHDEKQGFTFNQYTVTGNGTLADPTANNTTLSMTAANQTIGATWKKLLTNGDIHISIPSQPCTGSALTPVVTVTDGETGLTKDTHYTVSLPEGRINPGNYTVTITAVETSNYSGSTTATFTIYRNFVFTNSDWMTWYGAEDLTVNPNEMETYVVTEVTSSAITTSPTVGNIYKDTPMLLKRIGSNPVDVHGYAPAAPLSLSTEISDAYIGGVSSFDGYTTGTVYVLAGSEFVRARVTGNTTFNPSKCFIYIPASSGSRLHIVADGDATGMRAIDDTTEETWYTINGFKLSKRPTRAGMYMCNGKKIVIK